MKKNVLDRVVILSRQDAADGVQQFRTTIPKDFVDLMGLKKGDKLKITLIIGSGMITLERAK